MRDDRAARFGRALRRRSASSACRAPRRSPRRGRVEVDARRRRQAHAHHAQHRDRRRRAAVRAADPGIAGGESAAPPTPCGTCASCRARLVVLGGGPIGCELAQCFARFGSQVTQVEMLPRILPREDPEISELVAQRFRAEGIDGARRAQGEGGARRERREDRSIVEHDGRGQAHRVRRDPVRRRARAEHRRATASRTLGIARDPAEDRRDERIPADDLSEHLRLRRRGGPVPVHAHRLAQAWYRGGQRAVRPLPANSGPTTR